VIESLLAMGIFTRPDFLVLDEMIRAVATRRGMVVECGTRPPSDGGFMWS